jgi:hypothetical protein
MSNLDLGWSWFNVGAQEEDYRSPPNIDQELETTFARCFRGEDGLKVLRHLRTITLDRVLGPSASDSLLRHMDGQRQLFAYILSLVQRGNGQTELFNSTPNWIAEANTENVDE